MNDERDRPKSRPVDFTEDEIAEAARGRSEEVLGRKLEKERPVEVSESEVEAAGKGRSEEVLGKKQG